HAQLETANARLVLAGRELHRAEVLAAKAFGTEQTVDQRTADQRTGQAAVDDAKAQIRDAEFDLEHCRITAPFTGRIGTHLVSVGNLIAGSRTATSPTTLLTTLVSLDPIYLDFDMSESDFLTFSRDRARLKGGLADKVEIALGDDTEFARQGTLDFVDNALNRSSGTIHARATVPNPDGLLTPGLFARVRLVVGAAVPALLVPDTAVLPDQSQHIVMTVAPDGTVVPKQVEIGDLRGGLRVIRSGLTPNDQVIIEGIPHAAPGAKVAPEAGTIHYAAAGGHGYVRVPDMRLTHFFIDRPRFPTVLSLFLTSLGFGARAILPIAQSPEILQPPAKATSLYPGASGGPAPRPAATPLEREITGVENMLYMNSQSPGDGSLAITVTFAIGTDLNIAQMLTQNRVQDVLTRLPEDV